MRRVTEVIDCWFDSGAMPFAQWGYPHQPGSAERFAASSRSDLLTVNSMGPKLLFFPGYINEHFKEPYSSGLCKLLKTT